MELDKPDTTNGSGQPNVVLIITDDQTWRQRVAMPAALAWFGWRGTIWHNYYVSLPWCGPSRATMVTGQYAFHHGLYTVSPPLGGYDRLNNTNTLPVWLQRAGYRTAYIGKYINAVPEGTIPPGYDDWQAISGTARHYFGGTINDNGTMVTYTNQEADYITDVLARRAVATIDRLVKAGSPFYLSVGTTAPHIGVDNVPPTPAPRHDGLYAAETMPRSIAFNERDVSDKPAYVRARRLLDAAAIAAIEDRWRSEMESLLAVDDLFVAVVNELEACGVLDNTIVMLTSDNGYMHGEHRIPGDKRVPYREAINVPMMVAGPGFPAGAKVHTTAANIDVAPTIVTASGAVPDLAMDGVSLQSTISNDTLGDRRIVIERYDKDCYQGLVGGGWWYVRYVSGEEELYGHASPAQRANEANRRDRATTLEGLRSQLDAMVGTPLDWCGGS